MSRRPEQDRGLARAAVVNRTHRVIREEALKMQEERRRSRSLFVPLAISSALLLVVLYAVWRVLDTYELNPNGIPDASDQVMLILLWSLPVTMVVLGLIWVGRRNRNGSGEQTL